MGSKAELNPVAAIRLFPSFPVVLTVMGDEDSNIITVGLVHVFSFRPTVLGVGIAPSRYSHELLHRYPDFTVNVPGKDLVEETNYCGAASGRKVDKFHETGLTRRESQEISSPGIEECRIIFECRKTEAIDVGDHTWFLGEVARAEQDEDYVRERTLMYWSGDFRTIGDIIRKK
ncbi:MAG: flavin reductase family protein [Methanomassiliicoccales archaeon]